MDFGRTGRLSTGATMVFRRWAAPLTLGPDSHVGEGAGMDRQLGNGVTVSPDGLRRVALDIENIAVEYEPVRSAARGAGDRGWAFGHALEFLDQEWNQDCRALRRNLTGVAQAVREAA